jgi:hypothetical protein
VKDSYIKSMISWALVAHTCNPSSLGGKGQEDHSSRPAQANTLWDPILKIHNPKRAGGLAQVVKYLLSKSEALSSNPSTVPPPKKKKKRHGKPYTLGKLVAHAVFFWELKKSLILHSFTCC